MTRVSFIPRYIGALKYYEKLVPALRERGFSSEFVLLEDAGMRAYCDRRGLPFDARFLDVPLGRVPLYSHIAHERRLFRLFGDYLNDKMPSVIVSEPRVGGRELAFIGEARARGIPVRFLQWAQLAGPSFSDERTFSAKLLALRAKRGSLMRGVLYGLYLNVLLFVMRTMDLFSGKRRPAKETQLGQLGVIDEVSRASFIARGWRMKNTSVVGSAYFTIAKEISQRFRSDARFRDEILARYGLSSERMRILVLSTPFHRGSHAVFLSDDGQREYFKKIFDDIRDVFPSESADILFKLHPREPNIYGKAADLGMRIYHNEADTDELIVLSDLVITHPMTAANFIILASGTPALFINFTPLTYFDRGKEIYGLRNIITSHQELGNSLKFFHSKKLPPQYDAARIDTGALDKIIEFVASATGG